MSYFLYKKCIFKIASHVIAYYYESFLQDMHKKLLFLGVWSRTKSDSFLTGEIAENAVFMVLTSLWFVSYVYFVIKNGMCTTGRTRRFVQHDFSELVAYNILFYSCQAIVHNYMLLQLCTHRYRFVDEFIKLNKTIDSSRVYGSTSIHHLPNGGIKITSLSQRDRIKFSSSTYRHRRER